MQSYFVGTDIGTLGTKSVVVDLEGRIVGQDYAEASGKPSTRP